VLEDIHLTVSDLFAPTIREDEAAIADDGLEQNTQMVNNVKLQEGDWWA
jgi:hypothetical protein